MIRDVSKHWFSPIIILFCKAIEILIKTLIVAKTLRLWIKIAKVGMDVDEKSMIFDENERNLKLLVSELYPQNFKKFFI